MCRPASRSRKGKHRKVNFGVGYGSEEKARVQIDWRHVNFLGGARTAGVQARYSALDKGVRVNFKEPYFFGPRNDFTLTGQSWHTDEPAFTLDYKRRTCHRDEAIPPHAADPCSARVRPPRCR